MGGLPSGGVALQELPPPFLGAGGIVGSWDFCFVAQADFSVELNLGPSSWYSQNIYLNYSSHAPVRPCPSW